jgi:hypothetical protein
VRGRCQGGDKNDVVAVKEASRTLGAQRFRRSARAMEDLVFVLLTLVVFAVLGLVAWGVERL